jgi:hypothetical protein
MFTNQFDPDFNKAILDLSRETVVKMSGVELDLTLLIGELDEIYKKGDSPLSSIPGAGAVFVATEFCIYHAREVIERVLSLRLIAPDHVSDELERLRSFLVSMASNPDEISSRRFRLQKGDLKAFVDVAVELIESIHQSVCSLARKWMDFEHKCFEVWPVNGWRHQWTPMTVGEIAAYMDCIGMACQELFFAMVSVKDELESKL